MGLSLTYSLADQDFHQTKSLGIFNISLQLLQTISRDERASTLAVLANSGLQDISNCPHQFASRGATLLFEQGRADSVGSMGSLRQRKN